MDKESAQLQHCVQSYEASCHQGNCHIVSLRNRAGASLSTIELAYRDESKPHWKIVQHRGLSNQPPDASLQALEPLLLDHVYKKADVAALKQWQETVKEMATRLTPIKADVAEKFDLDRLRKLSESMGGKRLMRLFVEESALKAAEEKYENKNNKKQ